MVYRGMEADVSISRQLFVYQVNENLRQMLETDRELSTADIAAATGYTVDSVQKFRAGLRLSVPLAVALVDAYPTLGRHVVCPTCGRYYPRRKRL